MARVRYENRKPTMAGTGILASGKRETGATMDLSRIPEQYRERVEREMAEASANVRASYFDREVFAPADLVRDTANARNAALARYLKIADEADAAAAEANMRTAFVGTKEDCEQATEDARREVWARAMGKADAALVTAEELADVERFAEGDLTTDEQAWLKRASARLAAEVRRLTERLVDADADRAVVADLVARNRALDAALASLREKARAALLLPYGERHDALRAEVEGAPVERTPEVVLRAMLRAYEEHAIEKARAYYAKKGIDNALLRASSEADSAVAFVRDSLAMLLANGHAMHSTGSRIARDYEARLRGDRPLDAPPAEV